MTYTVSKGIVNSHVSNIVEEFLNGDYFVKSLAAKTLDNIDMSDDTSYEKVLTDTKKIINQSKRRMYNGVIYYDNKDTELTVKQQAMLIRLTSMAHKSRIIVFNNSVLHYPKTDLQWDSETEILNAVNQTTLMMNREKKVNRWKDKFKLKNLFSFLYRKKEVIYTPVKKETKNDDHPRINFLPNTSAVQ